MSLILDGEFLQFQWFLCEFLMDLFDGFELLFKVDGILLIEFEFLLCFLQFEFESSDLL